MKGRMNIDFSETYDQEDDVYYVSFKTGEPSFCVEVDDKLLLEVGMFTKLPTGFRMLNFHKSNVNSVQLDVMVRKVRSTIEESQESFPSIKQREAAVECIGKTSEVRRRHILITDGLPYSRSRQGRGQVIHAGHLFAHSEQDIGVSLDGRGALCDQK